MLPSLPSLFATAAFAGEVDADEAVGGTLRLELLGLLEVEDKAAETDEAITEPGNFEVAAEEMVEFDVIVAELAAFFKTDCCAAEFSPLPFATGPLPLAPLPLFAYPTDVLFSVKLPLPFPFPILTPPPKLNFLLCRCGEATNSVLIFSSIPRQSNLVSRCL
jgi:hypothetical protein